MDMDKLREILSRKGVLAGVAFVAGLIIGLVVLGWGLFPVQWTNGSPADLRADYQQDYLRMAIQSFALDPDPELALARWNALGPSALATINQIEKDPGNLTTIQIMGFSEAVATSQQRSGTELVLSSLPAVVENTNQAVAATQGPGEEESAQPTATLKPKQQTAQAATALPEVVKTGETPAAAAGSGKSGAGNSSMLTVALSVFCLLTLILAGVLFYQFVWKKRKGQREGQPGIDEEGEVYPETADFESEAQTNENVSSPTGTPISQFMTTFMIGDDVYDDSFSIDSPLGEFLGECGVGISDTIGVGDPKKVSAFEVWLFDKNDIQTVTKVLMSEHSFADPATVQKLRAKGEPVLAEAGKRLILETATLQLEARIVDLNYGQGALPTNSYFERMTLELAVWPKQKSSGE